MILRSSFEPKSQMQFCALAYRGQQADPSFAAGNQIILILIYSQAAGLRLLASPDWQQTVPAWDHAYIGATFADFGVRARLAPEALLEQVSSLSVGPLVTHTCGNRLEEHAELQTLSLVFTELK
jgi:hypothetical protein